MLGGEGTILPLTSSGNVPPDCSLGTERGGMKDLLRLLIWAPAPKPSGGCFCHPTGGVAEH